MGGSYVDIARDIGDAQHPELVGRVALDGLQLLGGQEPRESTVPVGTVDDHGRVRSNVLVEGRRELLGVGEVLFCSSEDILGFVADMVLNVNLRSVNAIKSSIYERVEYIGQ